MERRLAVVHMQARYERDVRNHRGIDIGQSQSGMLGKDMAAAGFAPLAIALRRFVIRGDIFFAPRNLDAFRLPQSEGVDGTCRPRHALQ